jgi:ABC-type thiamine transport system substrate-binding protein
VVQFANMIKEGVVVLPVIQNVPVKTVFKFMLKKDTDFILTASDVSVF